MSFLELHKVRQAAVRTASTACFLHMLTCVCVREMAWVATLAAAPVLFAHAWGHKNIIFFQWGQNLCTRRYDRQQCVP